MYMSQTKSQRENESDDDVSTMRSCPKREVVRKEMAAVMDDKEKWRGVLTIVTLPPFYDQDF